MTSRILEPPSDSQTLVQRAAFRLLFAHAKPIPPAELAEYSGIRIDSVSKLVDLLDGAGRIRPNAADLATEDWKAMTAGLTITKE